MPNLALRLRVRAVRQTHAKRQAFETPENKRQMYGGQALVERQH